VGPSRASASAEGPPPGRRSPTARPGLPGLVRRPYPAGAEADALREWSDPWPTSHRRRTARRPPLRSPSRRSARRSAPRPTRRA